MGHLYLSAGNRYEGGTRIGTGKIFVPSADALGNNYSLKPASIAFIRFETRSESYLVPTDNIDFPESHSIAITDDAMANIDTGSNSVVLRGFITNFAASNIVGGSFRKLGSGILTLSGTNGYTGATRISEGVLEIINNASLPANGPLQFGPAGGLKLMAAGNYGVITISPVVITNSIGTTNTETMNGLLNLAVSGVNVAVSQLSLWPEGSRLTVANLTNGSVRLPATINNTPTQLAMIKSAENPTYVASVAPDGLLSFAPAVSKITPAVTVTPAVGGYIYSASYQGPGVSEVNTGGSTGAVTLSYSGTGSTSYPTSSTPPMNAGTYTVTATVASDSTYNQASSVATAFTITKANPTVSLAPTASAVTVGEQLSASNLSGGTASVAGTYTWTTPSTVVGSSGSYPVTFTPTDSANYNPASTSANVTANSVGTTYSGWLNGGTASDAAFLDYVFGAAIAGSLDPSLKPTIAVTDGNLVLTYNVRQGTAGLTVTAQTSADLATGAAGWGTSGVTDVAVGTPRTVNGVSVQQRTASISVSGGKKFLRIQAVQAAP
jgi:autotransporter-associated beta strand protein